MYAQVARWFLVLGWVAVSSRAWAAEPTAAPVVNVEQAPVRLARPFSVGLSASWPWMAGHDVTVPLPTVRIGVNLSPRRALDLTAGTLSHDTSGRWTMLDLGAHYFLSDGSISPYFMTRVGAYFNKADEGKDSWYPYAVLGAGIEYTCRCGFVAWGQLGPALMGFSDGGSHSAAAGIYTSIGIGYRFGATGS